MSSTVQPHDSAFSYSPRTIVCGPAHRWQIRCRLWNVDAGPTPKDQRQYILARSDPVLADTITQHVTEATLDAKFEILDTPHVAEPTPSPAGGRHDPSCRAGSTLAGGEYAA